MLTLSGLFYIVLAMALRYTLSNGNKLDSWLRDSRELAISGNSIAVKASFKVFSELTSSCTVYFYGNYDSGPSLFPHYYKICAKAQLAGQCAQINNHYTYSPRNDFTWTHFNSHYNHNTQRPVFNGTAPIPGNGTLRGRTSDPLRNWHQTGLVSTYYKIFAQSPKYGHKCWLLVRGRIQFDDNQDHLKIPYNGRLNPNFIFVHSAPERRCYWNCKNLTAQSDEEGTSVVLLLTTATNNSNNSDSRFKFEMHGYERAMVDLLQFRNLNVSFIMTLWKQTRKIIILQHQYGRNSDRNSSEKVGHKRNGLICGNTPIVRNYQTQRFYDFAKSTYRIWDPQEDCVFETIISKYFHNHSLISRYFGVQWPFALEFGDVLAADRPEVDGLGKLGKFYTPVSGRFQGFRYSLYIDRRSMKSEFDMRSLLKPFEALVWTQLVLTIALVAIFLRLISKSFKIFWIFSVIMEQGELEKKLRQSHSVCMIALVWLLASIQLRFSYTSRMLSEITAERVPETPKNILELLSEPYKTDFDIFTPHDQSDKLITWKGQDLYGLSKDTLWETIKPLQNEEALKLIQNRGNQNNQTQNVKVKGKLVRLYHRIALISFTHPSKLRIVERGHDRDSNRDKPTEWSPSLPSGTLLVILGGRLQIRNKDDHIRSSLWAYHGKRNYFTDFFVRDLSSLVESGVYGWWEKLLCKHTETMFFMDSKVNSGVNNANPKGNYFPVACSGLSGKIVQPYQGVKNKEIMVIWALYSACLIVCVLGYLKEVIRFDLPGRPCKCVSCCVEKYKQE